MGMLVQRKRGIGVSLHLVLNVPQADVALIARTRNNRVLHRSAGIGLVKFGHATSANVRSFKRCRFFQSCHIGGARLSNVALSLKLIVAVGPSTRLTVAFTHLRFVLSIFLIFFLLLGATVRCAQVRVVVLGLIPLLGLTRLGLAVFFGARNHRYLHVVHFLLQL
jgi:hypothetical protein